HDAVFEGSALCASGLNCEAGFADAAGAKKGQHAASRVGQDTGDLAQFALAAEERGRLVWQIGAARWDMKRAARGVAGGRLPVVIIPRPNIRILRSKGRKQIGQPGLVKERSLACRPPECPNLLGFAAGSPYMLLDR